MVESVGKKLNQARVKRGLTIDEAAHATKLRPDKIAALESDDYSRFANNIYAKGFLQIYARFLNVDVSDFSRTLDNANPISVSDYQYLSNAPNQRRETTQIQREERKPPSIAPLLAFIVILAIGAAYFWYRTNSQRIAKVTTGETQSTEQSSLPPPPTAATPAPTAATPAPQMTSPAPAIAKGTPAPAPRSTPAPAPNHALQLATATPGQLPAQSAAKADTSKAVDKDFVTPTAVSTADPTAHPVPASGVNEVLVAAVKTTWVTVRTDDPKAPPIFEDYVYPNANPLKLKGARFFIDARDRSAVQITKNGLPFAYQAPNIPVQ